MARVGLFFGDSNTRGFGVMPQQRYAAELERSLGAALKTDWQFAVALSASDLRIFGEKLRAALERYHPDLLVVQCPTGPASYFINFPRWLKLLLALPAWHLRWRTERAIAAEVSGDPARQRTLRDAELDGRYVDSVYRFRLSNWAVLRRIRGAAGRRYGVVGKATRERYVERMLQLREIARAQMHGPILFFGLLPMGDSLYPGYTQRACAWNSELAKCLPDTTQRCFYVDVMEGVAALPGGWLLEDESHLNINGHRRLAELLLPELLRLIEDVESTPAHERSALPGQDLLS